MEGKSTFYISLSIITMRTIKKKKERNVVPMEIYFVIFAFFLIILEYDDAVSRGRQHTFRNDL